MNESLKKAIKEFLYLFFGMLFLVTVMLAPLGIYLLEKGLNIDSNV